MKEKYHGACNLRFDDTNPAKEDVEYMESIKADIKWLGFDWDELRNASDYFEKMYECAVKLIKDGKEISGIAMGDGPIDAAFLAIEQIAGHHSGAHLENRAQRCHTEFPQRMPSGGYPQHYALHSGKR